MAAQIADLQQNFGLYKEALERSLYDPDRPWTVVFNYLERKTNVPRLKIFYGFVVFLVIYLTIGYGAQLLCNFIGVLYPAYVSIHAIEANSKEDVAKWLTYWVTFAFLTLVEFFSVAVTSIIPCYWLIKCLFLIWCMVPIEKNGSVVIYTKLVQPYFLGQQLGDAAAT